VRFFNVVDSNMVYFPWWPVVLVIIQTVTGVTPTQKVLNMLTELLQKGQEDKANEVAVMKQYTAWVHDREIDLNQLITTAKRSIDKSLAFIESSESSVEQLASQIGVLDEQIASDSKDKAAAMKQRASERDEFLKQEVDYAESVEALDAALQTMKAQSMDQPQAEMFLQQMAVRKPGMRRVLAALLQVQDSNRDDGAPAVAGYEFQSHGIIEVLEELLAKFKAQLSTLQTEEAERAHNFDLEELHLSNLIAKNSEDREDNAGIKARTAAASAKEKAKLAATREDLASDAKLLKEILATSKAKSAAFTQNQKVRADEIEALTKAIEIIGSPAVAESYAKHINFAQQKLKSVSLLQLKSMRALSRADARAQAAQLLRTQASKLSSKELALAAVQVAGNPFSKVIDLIKSLIARLKEEAENEATHKSWCDAELKKNKLKRNKKTTAVESLQAQIDSLIVDIKNMGEQISTLDQEQAELTKQMSEATSVRTKEKATNEQTIADAKAGTVAVQQAIVILREFYSNAAGFLQQSQVPEMAEYKGMQDSSSGVLGMLEVIETDFTRLATKTTADEAQAAAEYKAFMADAKVSKKKKHDLQFKTSLQKDESEFNLNNLKKDLAATQEELDRANDYYSHLKPNCVEIHVSYEERVVKRKQEIAALREAYKILNELSAE